MSNKNSYTTEEMKEMVKRIGTLTKAEINKFKKSITKDFIKDYLEDNLSKEEIKTFLNSSVEVLNVKDNILYQRAILQISVNGKKRIDLFAAKKKLINDYLPQLKKDIAHEEEDYFISKYA